MITGLMDGYRPISKQGVHDPDLDGLHDEVMPWMVAPLNRWLWPFLYDRKQAGALAYSRMEFLEGFELAHRLRVPFERREYNAAANDASNRVTRGGVFGLDLVGYALHRIGLDRYAYETYAATLEEILTGSGSAWEVNRYGDDSAGYRYRLTRRALAAAKDAIADIEVQAETPGAFLKEAWSRIATRDPDPNGAYDNAVKAVEAAAHDVVSPANGKATLGTMIGDMKAKPDKWEFTLGDMDTVIAMCQALWSNHFRHGTQERGPNTLKEADAAVHLAIPLVRYFVGGMVELA